MKYTKPPLTYDQQADLLLSRGLIAEKVELISKLKSVSYYRLSGYLYPFRKPDDSFVPGTSLGTIWALYAFDRQLRLLILDAIERFEVSIKTNIIYLFSHVHGPFGYLGAENLPGLYPNEHADLISKIAQEKGRSHEPFVKHFNDKYGDSHSNLPLWMAAEIMTYGMLLTFLKGIPKPLRQQIAGIYHIPDEVLFSWARALNGIRNLCAHHCRLWNRELGYKMLFPKERKYPEWHSPVAVPNNRVFGILTILKFFINQIAPQSHWQKRLEDLLDRYPNVPRKPMGFAENWKECPIWK